MPAETRYLCQGERNSSDVVYSGSRALKLYIAESRLGIRPNLRVQNERCAENLQTYGTINCALHSNQNYGRFIRISTIGVKYFFIQSFRLLEAAKKNLN